MPCDTITTTKLDLKKANADVLEMALIKLGLVLTHKSATRIVAQDLNTTVIWEAGKGTTVKSSRGSTVSENLQQEYSRQAVQWVAKKSGWQVKQESENMFAIQKR